MISRVSRRRFFLVNFALVPLFPLILYQVVRLTIQNQDFLVEQAQRQHNLFIQMEPERGAILDRNFKELATNLKVPSIYAVPRDLKAKERSGLVKELSGILNLPPAYLDERLSRPKDFVWLKRRISFPEADLVRQLGNRNLGIQYEPKRFYPNGKMLSNTLGFCDIDHAGLEGLELLHQDHLKGNPGYRRTKRDARGREIVALEEELLPPINGSNLVLTIDQYIQHVTDQALDRAFEKWQAEGAVAVVMHPKTGEILALSSRPTFDPNQLGQSRTDARRNRAITDMFEPGSVFKIVTVAAALNEGKVTLEDQIDCEQGEWRARRSRVIHDVHPYGRLKIPEVLIHSSNIGTVKIAMELGEKKLYDYIKKFGFGEKTGIDFPGEASGILRPWRQWSQYSITSIPYGQEVAATAIQMLRALSVFANGGYRVRPYLLREIRDPQDVVLFKTKPDVSEPILKPEVARTMSEMLEGVVNEGTGKKAQIEGIRVAGKTGTAQKLEPDGSYSHRHFVSTFIGYAPADDPILAMVVALDDPKPYYYGGTVAAPVFREVMERSLLYLGQIPRPQGARKLSKVVVRAIDEKSQLPKSSPHDFRGASPQVR